jgi:hypothetical protein
MNAERAAFGRPFFFGHSEFVQRLSRIHGATREFAMRDVIHRFAAPATLLFLGLAFTALSHLAP